MKTDKKHLAFNSYLKKDLTLRQVAVEVGVARSTVERWSSDDHWPIQRERHWAAKREAIAKEHLSEYVTQNRTMSDQLYNIFRDGMAEHRAYAEGLMPKSRIKYSVSQLCNVAKALALCNAVETYRADRLELGELIAK